MTQHVPPMTHDQLAWIEESQRRGVKKALKKQARVAAVGFVLLFGGLFVAGKAWTDTLHDGLVGSCDRVNVLRAQSNGSDLVSFRILSLSGQREASLAEGSKDSESKTHSDSAKALFGQAKLLTVTQLTDCERAVDHPKSYDTPIAGPIGDPATGELNQGVKRALDASAALLKQEARDDG